MPIPDKLRRLMNFDCDEESDFEEIFEIVQSRGLEKLLMRRYCSPEDRADAIDGAMMGVAIDNNIREGINLQEELDEVYNFCLIHEHIKPKSPFYIGLREALLSCNRLGILQKLIKKVKKYYSKNNSWEKAFVKLRHNYTGT